MILTVDIGNTNIVFGGFENDKLVFVSQISTDAAKTDSEYAVKINALLELNGIKKAEIKGAAISSVVPPLTYNMQKAIQTVYGVKALVVGPGIKTGINLLVDNPATVGADLVCACVAAYNLYTPPVLVVDMGTATKMMVVDEKAAFRGVSIIPGADISLKALAGRAALLPQINLEAPDRVIATNTEECMRSGVVFGNASLVDGMIDRIEDELGFQTMIVATGGLSKAVIPHCKHKITIDQDLLLKGLHIIYKKN